MAKNFKYLVLLHTVGTLPFFLFLMYRYCHHIAASLLGFDPLLLIFKKNFFLKFFYKLLLQIMVVGRMLPLEGKMASITLQRTMWLLSRQSNSCYPSLCFYGFSYLWTVFVFYPVTLISSLERFFLLILLFNLNAYVYIFSFTELQLSYLIVPQTFQMVV